MRDMRNIVKTYPEVQRYQDIIYHESFLKIHYNQLEPASFIHALSIAGHKNNSKTFNGDTHQQFPYDLTGMTVQTLWEKLTCQYFWTMVEQGNYQDNYHSHVILYKCQKIHQNIWSCTQAIVT